MVQWKNCCSFLLLCIGLSSSSLLSSWRSAISSWRYRKLNPLQLLATTPLFFVVNSHGSPYLQEDAQSNLPEQRIVTYFMSSEEAKDYLDEMIQSSGHGSNEFRLMTVSLEKILDKIRRKKQNQKLGRFPMAIVHKIQTIRPHAADRGIGSTDSSFRSNIWEQKEIIINKDIDSCVLVPWSFCEKTVDECNIFMFPHCGFFEVRLVNVQLAVPYYFALEDLSDDLKVMTNSTSFDDKITVCDLSDTLMSAARSKKGVQSGWIFGRPPPSRNSLSGEPLSQVEASWLKNFIAIVPPRRELEMIRNFYRNCYSGVPNLFAACRK